MSLLDQLLAVPLEEVSTWPAKDQQWYHDQLEREISLQSPARFAERWSDGQWEAYRHLEVTSDAIVSMIEDDDCDLLVVEEPVRHGKSMLCSKFTPAWFTLKYRWPVLLSSYEATFAQLWGGRALEVVKQAAPYYGIELKKDAQAKSAWELIGGGGMNTAGAGGSITGRGGVLLICDDPIKSREDAMSETVRNKFKEWWDSTWTTRREVAYWPDGRKVRTKYILIMSRWHLDDPIGWIKKRAPELGMRVKVLRMPALAEDDDMLGRRPGEALCPQLFTEADLHEIRKDSPIGFPALYQQRPVPEGGGMFERGYFREYSRERIDGDDYVKLADRYYRMDELRIFGTMDTAYTRNKRSDYTALGVWAATPGDLPDLLLLHMYRKRVDHAEHAPLIEQAWTEHNPRWIGLEKINATLSLFSQAQRSGVIMRWLEPDKNKVARAETAVSMGMNGRLWIDGAKDNSAFLDECVTFPNGAHDDQVDVLAYAAGEVFKGTVRGRHRKKDPETLEERIWKSLEERQRIDRRHPLLGRF